MKAYSTQSKKITGSLGNETLSLHNLDVIACPQNKERLK